MRDIKDFLEKLHTAVKQWIIQNVFQRVLVPFLLTLLYFFVVGSTKIFVKIFLRKKLVPEKQTNPDSMWVEASGYEENLQTGISQS